jgi:thiamine biosynthesis protein ThiS
MPAKGENWAPGSDFHPTQADHRAWSDAVRLTVNGEAREAPAATTVAALVTLLGLDRRKLAVERNLEIVPRSAFASTLLCDGDRIEIVAFVGGG